MTFFLLSGYRTTITSTKSTTIIAAIITAQHSAELSPKRTTSQSSVFKAFLPALADPLDPPLGTTDSQTHCYKYCTKGE